MYGTYSIGVLSPCEVLGHKCHVITYFYIPYIQIFKMYYYVTKCESENVIKYENLIGDYKCDGWYCFGFSRNLRMVPRSLMH